MARESDAAALRRMSTIAIDRHRDLGERQQCDSIFVAQVGLTVVSSERDPTIDSINAMLSMHNEGRIVLSPALVLQIFFRWHARRRDTWRLLPAQWTVPS